MSESDKKVSIQVTQDSAGATGNQLSEGIPKPQPADTASKVEQLEARVRYLESWQRTAIETMEAQAEEVESAREELQVSRSRQDSQENGVREQGGLAAAGGSLPGPSEAAGESGVATLNVRTVPSSAASLTQTGVYPDKQAFLDWRASVHESPIWVHPVDPMEDAFMAGLRHGRKEAPADNSVEWDWGFSAGMAAGVAEERSKRNQSDAKSLANYIGDTFFEWDDAEDEASQKARLTAILENWASESARPDKQEGDE